MGNVRCQNVIIWGNKNCVPQNAFCPQGSACGLRFSSFITCFAAVFSAFRIAARGLRRQGIVLFSNAYPLFATLSLGLKPRPVSFLRFKRASGRASIKKSSAHELVGLGSGVATYGARHLSLNLPRAHAPGQDSFAPPALDHEWCGQFWLRRGLTGWGNDSGRTP